MSTRLSSRKCLEAAGSALGEHEAPNIPDGGANLPLDCFFVAGTAACSSVRSKGPNPGHTSLMDGFAPLAAPDWRTLLVSIAKVFQQKGDLQRRPALDYLVHADRVDISVIYDGVACAADGVPNFDTDCWLRRPLEEPRRRLRQNGPKSSRSSTATGCAGKYQELPYA